MKAEKFYVATGLRNYRLAREVSERLAQAGHVLTFDWTTKAESHLKTSPLPSPPPTTEEYAEIARAEIDGVIYADFMCLVLSAGRGSHTELGIAIACNVPVYIMPDPTYGILANDNAPPPFYFAPNVQIVNSESIADFVWKVVCYRNTRLIANGS